MKTLALYCCCLLLFCGVSAQTVEFKVITFSPGVMVGETPAKLGLDVSASAREVRIPDGGYMGIITRDGVAHVLTSSMPVEDVIRFVESARAKNTGTILRGRKEFELEMPLAPENSEADMIGDTLFIYWVSGSPPRGVPENTRIEGNFRFRLANMYDETELDTMTTRNWVVLKVPRVGRYIRRKVTRTYTIDALLIKVELPSEKIKSDEVLIKYASADRVLFMLDLLKQIPDNQDKYFYQCAAFDLSKHRLDMHLPVYHILKEQRTTQDPILQKYFQVLKKEYYFDQIGL
jgi:hypothetical protein